MKSAHWRDSGNFVVSMNFSNFIFSEHSILVDEEEEELVKFQSEERFDAILLVALGDFKKYIIKKTAVIPAGSQITEKVIIFL